MTYQETIEGYAQEVSCLDISYANQCIERRYMDIDTYLEDKVYEPEHKNNQYGNVLPTKEDRKNFVISYYRDLVKRARNEEHIANAVEMLAKLSA